MRILSLDELLEEGLVGVYRSWYLLPRRSTLPQLDRLRHQLADQIAGLPRPVDVTVYEQALIDFAAALRALPGAAEAGGTALADLAGATPTALRGGFGALLRKTNASSERVEVLLALLRLTNPPHAIIASLVYAPDQAPTVWDAVWQTLAPRLGMLPDADRARIEEIRNECEAVASAAGGARQRQEAYVRGLQALEQVPAVIRVAWPVFLANKYEGEAPKYLSATIEGSNLEHLAQSVPDLPASTGAEPPPPPPPPSPPQEPREPLTETPARGEEIIPFFTDVRFPVKVKRGEVQWLSVQLTLEAAAESVVTEEVPIEFARPEVGRQSPPEYVEVRLMAQDFVEVTGIWERTMQVYPKRDSQPVVFVLSSDKPGMKRLAIDFRHKDRMIGNIAFKCEVVEGATQRSGQGVILEEKPEIGSPADAASLPADLEIRVVRTADANGLAFLLNSTHPDLPLHAQPVGQIKLNASNPQAFFADQMQKLSDLAAAPGGTPDASVVQEIATMGEGLFEQLIPPELQAIYWEKIKPLVDSGAVKTLLINSDEPWIPWELVKPYRWNENDDSDESAGFLAEQFTLSRWLPRAMPSTIAVKRAALVMPDLNLIHVQAEQDFFRTLAQARNLQLQGPLHELAEVKQSIREGNFQLLHFATHGDFDKENADRSQLSLADGNLMPADLVGSNLRGIRSARPLIFLNACHSGQVALGLVGLGGWADKFFREARASAFVGTLWEVSDDLAAEFSRIFYSALADGKPLGEALRIARLEIRAREPANPTWLAYSLYGDPNGKVTFG